MHVEQRVAGRDEQICIKTADESVPAGVDAKFDRGMEFMDSCWMGFG
jgi:hypothetical protein